MQSRNVRLHRRTPIKGTYKAVMLGTGTIQCSPQTQWPALDDFHHHFQALEGTPWHPNTFVSSGDGYNHCFDPILSDFEHKLKNIVLMTPSTKILTWLDIWWMIEFLIWVDCPVIVFTQTIFALTACRGRHWIPHIWSSLCLNISMLPRISPCQTLLHSTSSCFGPATQVANYSHLVT